MAILTEPNQASKGKREDLADLISLVDAKATPVLTMAKKGKELGNSLFRWQADAYAAVEAATAGTVDGSDEGASDYEDPAAARAEISTYGKLFRRSTRVSTLAQQLSNIAGVKSELARGLSKKMIELKRDMETSICAIQDGQVDAGSSTPYLMKGLGTWIDTTGGSVPAIPAAFRTPTGNIEVTATTANITEATIQNVLKSIFDQSGDIKTFDMPLGSTLKRGITGLTDSILDSTVGVTSAPSIRTFNQDIANKKFTSRIDVFEGDFGTIRLHPSSFMPALFDGYVLPMDKLEIRYGVLPYVKVLPDNGGGPARMVEAFAGLVVHNPLVFGKFDLGS